MATPPGFAAARWWRTLNLLLQGALFLSLFAGLNYLALHYSWRHDLTSHRHHSLSPETLSYLQNLRQRVRVVVTLDPEDDNAEVRAAHRDVMGLLREYRHATAARPEGRVTVTELNVFQQRRAAEQLGIDRANTILVLCGDRRRVIGLDELYVVADRARQAFRGEQALTAAILDVANPARHRVWFLTGHGEMSPDDVDPLRGLSLLADELRLRNFAVGTLDLTQNRTIPEEAELLVIAAPQGPFNAFEVEQLRRYLTTRAGRVLVFLPPAMPHGLDDLLFDWGVLADDVWVVDNDPQSVTEGGDLRIRAFGAHPVTQTLIDYRIPLTLGPTRVARADPGRALDDGLRVTVLAATAETAWGERDYLARRVPEYNSGVDLRGLPDASGERRLGVIVASERVTPPAELPFSVRGGKLVLFGNADFIANHRLSSPGHLNLMLNAVNWAIDRDTRLNTPPRPLQRYRITLSQTEATRLRFSLLLVLPGFAAVLGLIVYWVRRA